MRRHLLVSCCPGTAMVADPGYPNILKCSNEGKVFWLLLQSSTMLLVSASEHPDSFIHQILRCHSSQVTFPTFPTLQTFPSIQRHPILLFRLIMGAYLSIALVIIDRSEALLCHGHNHSERHVDGRGILAIRVDEGDSGKTV